MGNYSSGKDGAISRKLTPSSQRLNGRPLDNHSLILPLNKDVDSTQERARVSKAPPRQFNRKLHVAENRSRDSACFKKRAFTR